jgi:hypothetical protein
MCCAVNLWTDSTTCGHAHLGLRIDHLFIAYLPHSGVSMLRGLVSEHVAGERSPGLA